MHSIFDKFQGLANHQTSSMQWEEIGDIRSPYSWKLLSLKEKPKKRKLEAGLQTHDLCLCPLPIVESPQYVNCIEIHGIENTLKEGQVPEWGMRGLTFINLQWLISTQARVCNTLISITSKNIHISVQNWIQFEFKGYFVAEYVVRQVFWPFPQHFL